MTSTQRQDADAQSTILSGQRWSGPDSFDMWHDYMNLGKLLLRLRGIPEAERWNQERPNRRAQPNSQRALDDGTSSISSLSDNSVNGSSSEYCRFCKQNGESARVYRSHKLKAEDGRVVCPVLWSYTCPICEATGEQAHTRKYCPRLQRQKAGGTSGPTSYW